jgi:hypothetical protein
MRAAWVVVVMIGALAESTAAAQSISCQVADILFGDVELSIVPHADYETAIVRSATFNDPKKNFGALLGEITVDREVALRSVTRTKLSLALSHRVSPWRDEMMHVTRTAVWTFGGCSLVSSLS